MPASKRKDGRKTRDHVQLTAMGARGTCNRRLRPSEVSQKRAGFLKGERLNDQTAFVAGDVGVRLAFARHNE